MKPLILVTGATGYVGGQLLQALLAAGHRVRCLARRPQALRTHAASGAEVVAGDVLDAASVRAAMEGVHTAYYLVHSMASADPSRKRTASRRGCSVTQPGRRECAGSFTWRAWQQQ